MARRARPAGRLLTDTAREALSAVALTIAIGLLLLTAAYFTA